MEPDVDAFLEHYGKKGMKWGVTTATSVATSAASSAGSAVKSLTTPKTAVAAARKQGRSDARAAMKERYAPTQADGKRKLNKGRAAVSVFDIGTLGVYTGSQMAKSAGYSSGKAAVIGFMGGPISGTIASEIRVRKAANAATRPS